MKMIDAAWAENFTREWIEAWNAHDLDAILSHYSDDIVFHSPRISLVTGDCKPFVSGKTELKAYWQAAMKMAKDLHFELDRIYLGSDALTLVYRNHRGQSVTETFVFDPSGMVILSIAAYA